MEILIRIREALDAAASAISRLVPGTLKAELKSEGRGPVTEADRVSNRVLQKYLQREGEGWLSEESVDDLVRLEKQRVWVVDPLDGTREFLAGVPEWCISVALVENGHAIAGGICNPATGESFLGSVETGITYNGQPARASTRATLDGAVILASRSEVNRGQWRQFHAGSFEIKPMGSVAYKLALVAAGLADATWTLTPKNEWDVAAGFALVWAAGGFVGLPDGSTVAFNNRSTVLPGLLACGSSVQTEILSLLDEHSRAGSAERKTKLNRAPGA